MLESFLRLDNKAVIKNFVPKVYSDRIYKTEKNRKEIADSDSTKTGIYRFYGIFMETNQMIGYVKYHILFDSPTIEIDRIEVDSLYRDKGYGTMLMRQSLCYLVNDFPHIKKVIVCSTASATPFYEKNQFVPYFGDNNLEKTLQKKY